MPTTVKEHLEYTVNEWTSKPFTKILDVLPSELNVIYDIGANVGGWTKVIKDKYPNSKVHAFEPDEVNFEALKECGTKLTAYKIGIYYGKDFGKLQWRADGNIGALFLEYVNAGEPRVDLEQLIELFTLEELKLPKPDLIKMDVEGAEENIIQNSTLLKETPYIIVEWHPDHIKPKDFFKKHLPNHKIMVNLEDKQFLLCLKSA